MLRKVDTLVVDKTGTLTEGKPKLVDRAPLPRHATKRSCCGSPRAWSAGASIRSRRRSWPAREERERGALGSGRTSSRSPGKGVRGHRRRASTSRSATARCWRSSASTVGAARPTAPRRCAREGADGDVRGGRRQGSPGSLGVADPIKATTPEAIRALHGEGIRVVMLTGDNRDDRRSGRAEARHRRGRWPRCCPTRRPRSSSACRPRGTVVAMAGDGINDAPALAQAARRHRHGHRHRRRDGERRRDAGQGRPARHRARAAAEPRRRCATSGRTCSSPSSTTRWGADRRGCALPVLRPAALADHRRGGDELQLGLGRRQRAAASDRARI